MYEEPCGWHSMTYGETGHEFREVMGNTSHSVFWAVEHEFTPRPVCERDTETGTEKSERKREHSRDRNRLLLSGHCPAELVPTCGPRALLLDDVPVFPGKGRSSPGTVSRE